jgi:chaperone modulatory protein CbpM
MLALRRPAGATGLVGLDVLARDAGLHPALVRRLVALGVVDPVGGTGAAPLFSGDAATRLVRAARLRRDLGLNYAGAVLAIELLARIDELEARLSRYEPITRPSR